MHRVDQRTATSAIASCTLTLLPAASRYTERTDRKENGRGEGRQGATKANQKNPPPHHASPTEVCEEGGPSRGTPWPPLPLPCLLEFAIVRVALASLATVATRSLLHGIPLHGAQHLLQYGMRFSVIENSFDLLQELQWLVQGLCLFVKTRERRGSSFSQLGLEPNHTGLTAQSLFFLEESCRVKRSDTQTFSNFANYFKRVLKLQKRSSSFSK